MYARTKDDGSICDIGHHAVIASDLVQVCGDIREAMNGPVKCCGDDCKCDHTNGRCIVPHEEARLAKTVSVLTREAEQLIFRKRELDFIIPELQARKLPTVAAEKEATTVAARLDEIALAVNKLSAPSDGLARL